MLQICRSGTLGDEVLTVWHSLVKLSPTSRSSGILCPSDSALPNSARPTACSEVLTPGLLQLAQHPNRGP